MTGTDDEGKHTETPRPEEPEQLNSPESKDAAKETAENGADTDLPKNGNVSTNSGLDAPENVPGGDLSSQFVNGFPMDLPPLGDLEQSKEDQERERMKLLVSHFDEQQMSRYAAFRRANIRRAAVRKYASHLLNQPISNSVAVVLAGMSKVLIGDIIELARDLQEKKQAEERKALNLPEPSSTADPEPLLPQYIRQAWRIYKESTGTVPGPKTKPGSGGRFF